MADMNSASLGRKLAYETLMYCSKNGSTASLAEITRHLADEVVIKIPGIDKYLGSYNGHSDPKWMTLLKFTLVHFDKAGWFKKSFPSRGYWTITGDGATALKKYNDPEKLGVQAKTLYEQWQKEKDQFNDDLLMEDELAAAFLGNDETYSITENEIDTADLKIKTHLRKLDPYAFQKLVSSLLAAMGYFVSFLAPKGRDGGIDLVCFQDPMGIKAPRIKVQVKHTPDAKVGRPTLSEFADLIKRDEVGIFVTSGDFSSEARKHEVNHDKHIRLISGTEFVSLITDNYDRLDEEGKSLLPLVRVYHLDDRQPEFKK